MSWLTWLDFVSKVCSMTALMNRSIRAVPLLNFYSSTESSRGKMHGKWSKGSQVRVPDSDLGLDYQRVHKGLRFKSLTCLAWDGKNLAQVARLSQGESLYGLMCHLSLSSAYCFSYYIFTSRI